MSYSTRLVDLKSDAAWALLTLLWKFNALGVEIKDNDEMYYFMRDLVHVWIKVDEY